MTALLPHPGDVFHDKVLAACHVINGFGKTTGLVQIDELGTPLETPSCSDPECGHCGNGAGRSYCWSATQVLPTGSVNPVVCECNDSGLNDIRGLHVTEAHVAAGFWQTVKPISPRVQWVPDAECAATG